MRKIIFFVIVIMLLTSSICFAENWYAVSKYYITDKEGKKTALRTVTKVPDQDTCYNMMIELSNFGIKGVDWAEAECVSGEEFDEALYSVFTKKSASGIYIYYIDAKGYETILDFPDNPSEECVILSERLSQKFRQAGKTKVEVICPDSLKKDKEKFSIGSTKKEVKAIQGEPTDIIGEVWLYGYDYVAFDDEARVSEYSNVLETLKVK